MRKVFLKEFRNSEGTSWYKKDNHSHCKMGIKIHIKQSDTLFQGYSIENS